MMIVTVTTVMVTFSTLSPSLETILVRKATSLKTGHLLIRTVARLATTRVPTLVMEMVRPTFTIIASVLFPTFVTPSRVVRPVMGVVTMTAAPMAPRPDGLDSQPMTQDRLNAGRLAMSIRLFGSTRPT